MSPYGKIFCFLISMFLCYTSRAQDDSLLSVQDAVKMALEHNFDVKIVRNEKEISTINNSWSVAGALPDVSGNISRTFGTNNLRQKLSNGTVTEKKGNTSQSLAFGVAVNWQIFDGFRMFTTKKKLGELERLGEYSFRKGVNETVFNVITGYYNIVNLNQQLAATEEQINLFEQRLELSQRRFDIGTGAKYEVLEAEVDLNEQRSNLIRIHNAIQIEKYSLASLLGQVPDTNFHVADTILVRPIPAIAEVQEKIQTQNPDILMATSNLTVSYLTKKEIYSALLPSVTLGGVYNFNRSSSGAGFNLFNQTYGPSGSVGISIPLFNGGITRKQLQVADVDIRNQQLQIDKIKNNVDAALKNAYANYLSAVRTIELETNNLKLARENIMIATERYKRLNITAVELRQIQISYNDTQFRLFNALYQAKTAEAVIAMLIGEISDI